jgi:hypothetical protein
VPPVAAEAGDAVTVAATSRPAAAIAAALSAPTRVDGRLNDMADSVHRYADRRARAASHVELTAT